MTISGVAEYLPKVPRASVYKLAQSGKIPCQKVGRHWRFRRDAVDERLDNGQERGNDKWTTRGARCPETRGGLTRFSGLGLGAGHSPGQWS